MSLQDIRPVRIREIKSTLPKNSVRTSYFLSPVGAVSGATYFPGFDVINLDQCVDQTHPGPPYREGGHLNVTHKTSQTSSLGTFSGAYYSGFSYHVDFRPSVGSTWCPYGITWGDPTGDGATAWRRFKPGRSGASIGQFFAEMRDLPRMYKVRVRDFRDAGSQYLNYQFGWMNLCRDLMSFNKTVENLDKRFQFLRNNNGKWKRRHGVLSEESTAVPGSTNFNVTPVPPTAFFKGGSFSHKSSSNVTTSKRVWFEARMKFYIPNLDSPVYQLYEVNKALGSLPTPALIYELMPWSWLVDYFGNLGDIIDNLSYGTAAENLVAKYAYIMSTLTYKVDYTCAFTLRNKIGTDSYGLRDFRMFHTHEYVKKWRVGANPFGFSTSWDLNPGQLAILTALGMSNFPRYH